MIELVGGENSDIYAGIVAVVLVNVLLITYSILALKEPYKSGEKDIKSKSKKE